MTEPEGPVAPILLCKKTKTKMKNRERKKQTFNFLLLLFLSFVFITLCTRQNPGFHRIHSLLPHFAVSRHLECRIHQAHPPVPLLFLFFLRRH